MFKQIGQKLKEDADRKRQAGGATKEVMAATRHASLLKAIISDTVVEWQKDGAENMKELDIEDFRRVVWNRIFSDLQEMFNVLKEKVHFHTQQMTDLNAPTPHYSPAVHLAHGHPGQS